MLGSTTLHGWIESAWYIQANPETGNIVTLDREFRGAGLYPKVNVKLDMGNFGDPTYSTTLSEYSDATEDSGGGEQDVMDVIAQSTDLISINSISKRVGLSRYKTTQLVEALVKDGQLVRSGERYGLGKQYGRE